MTRHRCAPVVLGLLVVAFAGVCARLASSEEAGDPADNGPETITFDARQKTMPLVELSHFRHASSKGLKIGCPVCHHTSKGIDVETGCSGCHGAENQGDVLAIKGALHKSCIGCHLERNGGAPKHTAPVKCGGCHAGAAPKT
jgi:hypothetical protein